MRDAYGGRLRTDSQGPSGRHEHPGNRPDVSSFAAQGTGGLGLSRARTVHADHSLLRLVPYRLAVVAQPTHLVAFGPYAILARARLSGADGLPELAEDWHVIRMNEVRPHIRRTDFLKGVAGDAGEGLRYLFIDEPATRLKIALLTRTTQSQGFWKSGGQ